MAELVQFLAVLCCTLSAIRGCGADVVELADIECKTKQLALTYGAKRIAGNVQSLERALNFAENCTHTIPDEVKDIFQPSASGVTFYVAVDGDDNNAGTEDKPFKTLQRARDALRQGKLAQGFEWQGGTVIVGKGKHYLPRPLLLTNEDSGYTSAPVQYLAATGANVTLSGGIPLQLQWQSAGDNVFSAKLPDNTLPFTSLFVNGIRQIRARYPNGDPQAMSGLCYSKPQQSDELCPGYLSANGGLLADVSRLQLNPETALPEPLGESGLSQSTSVASPTRPHKVAGDDHFTTFHYETDIPPFESRGFGAVYSFWNNPYASRPSGAKFDPTKWTNKTWKHPETAVVHMFHPGLWGNWMYEVSSIDRSKDEIHFERGGWQEARGGGVNRNHFYVENVAEELDMPGEWFLDENSSMLFFYPNSSQVPDLHSAEVVAARWKSLIEVQGSERRPVSHITIAGFTFTETATTFMDFYEVPSGGDWSIHRGGTVFIQSAVNLNITHNVFDQTGGNALFLSEHVRNCSIAWNEFRWTGDSAIAAVGRTAMIDGMKSTFPAGNVISNNHIHDIGVFGKQTSCYFQSLACGNTLQDNVCYNGPRAGVNFNDGFGGGNILQGNLIFNMVRETGDHGPFNSWDRQPYVTPEFCHWGGPSIVPQPNVINQNFIINGYNGVWTLDHDDGSAFYNDTNNFLVFGGCKNYLGHDKMCGPGNVIVYPGIGDRSSGGRKCQTDDNGQFANQYYQGNSCFEPDGNFYSFSRCSSDDLKDTVYQTWNNTFYSPGAVWTINCGKQLNFSEWQQLGQDKGSSVHEIPSAVDIVAMGEKVLEG